MGSEDRILFPITCKRKSEHSFGICSCGKQGKQCKEKTLGSVCCKAWFSSVCVPAGMWSLWAGKPLWYLGYVFVGRWSWVQECIQRGGMPSEHCVNVPSAREDGLGLHLAGRRPIETISLAISWDPRSRSLSYWVGWEQEPVHVRTQTDCFQCGVLKTEVPKQPVPNRPFPLAPWGPVVSH